MKYTVALILFQFCSFAKAGVSHSDALNTATSLPRGGWLGGGKQGAEEYRKVLEEEVLKLSQQLRKTQDEVAILRESRKRRASVVVSRDDEESKEKVLKVEEENKALEQQISELESEKSELSNALQSSGEQVAALDSQLAAELKKNDETVAELKKKIEELKASVTEEVKKVSSENDKALEGRIAQAVEEATLKAEQEFAEKISKVEENFLKANEEALAEERLKSADAVEAERKKMRKLVKALAQREKEFSTQKS